MSKKAETEKNSPVVSPSEVLQSFLNAHPEDHFNGERNGIDLEYKISSGSLKLDLELGGGLGCGVHRFIGVREGGKTSAAMEFARNFQLYHKNRGFVVYYKAEGRLSPELILRSKIDTNPDKWKVVSSNIYEFVIDSMRALVKANDANEKKYQYLFIIDSIDGLITRAEESKTAEEVAATASSARMLSTLFKKMSLHFSENGHMAIFISQERSNIVINPYAPRAQSQGNSSGGNAIQHYVNFALNFKQRNKEDLILDENEEKIIGHNCKVELLKTTNDNTNVLIKYPIKRNSGIWREVETADVTLQWEFYKKEGKWFNLNEKDNSPLVKELLEKFGARIIKSFNGSKQYYAFFADNPDITEFLYNKYRSILITK